MLKKAQELGFAEADPTLTSRRRRAQAEILASLAFSTRVRQASHTEGIESPSATSPTRARWAT
jgi:homoserine dehydrogenase